jgi:hypothetical protein
MRVVNKRYFHFVAQPCGEIEYAHNNWSRTVRVPHLSEWIHSIRAKSKPNSSMILHLHIKIVNENIFYKFISSMILHFL